MVHERAECEEREGTRFRGERRGEGAKDGVVVNWNCIHHKAFPQTTITSIGRKYLSQP